MTDNATAGSRPDPPTARTGPRLLLATKVRKARHLSRCARCRRPVEVGQRIGYVEGTGWICVSPCLVLPPRHRAMMVEEVNCRDDRT